MLKAFSHYFPLHTLFQILTDAILLSFAVVLAIAFQVDAAMADWKVVVPSAIVFALVMILLNGVLGLYRPAVDGSRWNPVLRLALGVVVSVPAALLVFLLLPLRYFSSELLQLTLLALLGGVLALRSALNQRQERALFAHRALVVGGGAEALAVENALRHPANGGAELVGFYLPNTDSPPALAAEKKVFQGGSLLDVVREQRVGQVIVAVRERRGGALSLRELLDCKLRGVKVYDLNDFFEQVVGQVRLDSLKASWLIYGDGFRQGRARVLVKRVSDLVSACVLLLLALPVMLVTMLAILIEDGAPVFYRQERVGQGGRVFKVIKFRSMRRDAERDGQPRWASANDDRTTRVGRLIRKLRIDELPQLFNVLCGQMSLVGPRPERPFFVDGLTRDIPFYAVRHSVKPGLTGWAQVRYQYGASVDDAVNKLQYDLYYVKNHTLLLDTLILMETVRVVLTGEGAH
ncbi:TIGR03013 family PEP-CTERM/XrtA system glycosyltransferase [Pseudothauera nasutitermitis]|uniref:TIGR03013 family PEP-CTERM/XrtA system glycosyltransferase n=1 Tax=Pseudothauera nasutitermitis TaxID=2565930 RepID=A0A4S4AZC9_9RHOO|nr:TIGR03013 family XrtA/PEP-CTERM system glycosyltransferase [Pseudothauera nasutitermitis]THF65528.1 TIGR03013 family PEP-CTERM/XrtA system glycosyltransferase [Pseudothauera nasutitermitis]